jgi:lipoate-protein ligase B
VQNVNTLNVFQLGMTDYASAWDLQRRLFRLRMEGSIGDLLLLNEHRHVYTLGKRTDENHLLAERQELTRRGIEVCSVDRGGDVTYHGPGQLVGYPILDLHHYYCDIHRYLRDLEEVIIRSLAEYGVGASRDPDLTGVWVGDEKIAAIGIKVSRWITMHGFALNVSTDLSYFERIIPCGIHHKGVTSLARLLGRNLPMDEVSEKIIKHFCGVFGLLAAQRRLEECVPLVKNEQTGEYAQ